MSRLPAVFLFGLSLLLATHWAQAREDMNGFRADQYGDFTQKWKLVTVRYRKDTGELRFTYANDIAWKAMEQNRRRYPEGAVFTKLAVMTTEDRAFPSSAVPSGSRRTQFMVKDSKKFADTDGWGYALFDEKGKVIPEDVKAAAMACAACHRLVPERDFVFSQPLKLSSFHRPGDSGWGEKIQFVMQDADGMPKALRKLLPSGTKQVAVMQGEISKNVFSGTLDEIRPLLARETAAKGVPHVLLSEDRKQFSVVIPDTQQKDCNQVALAGFHTVPQGSKPLFEIHFCWEYPFKLAADLNLTDGKLIWEQRDLNAEEIEIFVKERLSAIDRLLAPDSDPYKGEANMPVLCRPDQLPKPSYRTRSFYSSDDFVLGLCTDPKRLMKTQYQLLYCEKSKQLHILRYFYSKQSEWRKEPIASCL